MPNHRHKKIFPPSNSGAARALACSKYRARHSHHEELTNKSRVHIARARAKAAMSLNKLQERCARAAATQAKYRAKHKDRLNTLQKLRRLEKQWVTAHRPALNTEWHDYEAELEADAPQKTFGLPSALIVDFLAQAYTLPGGVARQQQRVFLAGEGYTVAPTLPASHLGKPGAILVTTSIP
ncbi:hypothetical protein C8J57DRAFT_1254147 [Mycena rebaudengoi]|nr:hypothetical protein C8J57DRAFT_1254147 [Mycena rebaudengoi]